MKAFLMHEDRDFRPQPDLPGQGASLAQDLELDVLWKAMSGGDAFLLDTARMAVLAGLRNDLETVFYRQEVLGDCLRNPAEVRELYALAVEAIGRKRKFSIGVFSNYPSGILRTSLDALGMFVEMLGRLRAFAENHAGRFTSRGFSRLFALLQAELSEDYFGEIKRHLKVLKFQKGLLMSAGLGHASETTGHVLRLPIAKHASWFQRLFSRRPEGYTFYIAAQDESGAKALWELRDKGINLAANAVAQSVDHLLSFFSMLRLELAFYVGCLNLREALASMGAPMAVPRPEACGARAHRAEGLYDVSLALRTGRRPVGNDLAADGKDLIVITGANQGGKSTFLRAVGQAQLMMQCGTFVPANAFRASLCADLFTHFKREEDAAMKSGKLAEELGRMSGIADAIGCGSCALFNESFAATNEREGSEIARQVVTALVESGVKVVFVTHLFPFAHDLHAQGSDTALFLRADRQPDGARTFKLREGEPLETSYGGDLYQQVFGSTPASS